MSKLSLSAAVLIVLSAFARAEAPPATTSEIPRVDANVALSSLMALSDGYLTKLADSLAIVGATDAARAGDWNRIRPLLQEVEQRNIDAVVWFARPDGTYWTLEHGKEDTRLTDRPYFSRLVAGERVIGDLVVSKSTNKSVAIVAVPIRSPDGKFLGALGASVYLDRLSARISREMGLGKRMIFYAFDAEPLLGIVWDPTLIFADPRTLSPEVARAFEDMLKTRSGVERYSFRGKQREVMFRKSDVTGWWYAFGIVSG